MNAVFALASSVFALASWPNCRRAGAANRRRAGAPAEYPTDFTLQSLPVPGFSLDKALRLVSSVKPPMLVPP